MLAAIRLVISENGKLIETVTKNTDTQPMHLIKSLEDFQQSANDTISKLIEKSNESVTCSDDAEDDEDEEEDEEISPKRRKK